MTRGEAVLLTLVAYKVVLIGIGFWARKNNRDGDDFFLGGRRLGGWVAAISASASSSSAWTLLGVSGAAFAWGRSAIWLFPATLLGFLINWFWVAPRAFRKSREDQSVTLTEMLAQDAVGVWRTLLMRGGALILLFSFLFYVASQFQAAGDAFQSSFGLEVHSAIILGALIIVAYTLLGGFWAVSLTDTLQGLLMAASAVILPVVGVAAVGGWGALWDGMQWVPIDGYQSWFGGRATGLAFWFVLGTLGIGLGYPGQPHVVNRFMALQSEGEIKKGRVIAISWAVLVYSGMIVVGWCGRVLAVEIANGEQVFFALAHELFPPAVAGVMVASVLSAIMSTADSQLLVAASAVSYDWPRAKKRPGASLLVSRLSVLILSAVAVVLALYAPAAIFSRVLFAWHAIGSSFGPLLIARLAGWRLSGPVSLTVMSLGFLLTVYLNGQPNAPGDALERLLPFALALSVAFVGKHRPSPRGSRASRS